MPAHNKTVLRGDGVEANNGMMVLAGDAGWRLGHSNSPQLYLVAQALATIDFAKIEPTGSTGCATSDVAVTGAKVGDMVLCNPIASLPLFIVWCAACYSAGAVQVRVTTTASGGKDLAATQFRIAVFRI